MGNNVVCFGEVLFDVYPEGKKLGGGPLNVAAHLNQLGTNASIISRIGEDIKGTEILTAISQFGLSTSNIQLDSNHPTGCVTVNLDANGIPSYVIEKGSSWDYISCTKRDIDIVIGADALVFGSLASRSSKSKTTLFKLAAQSNLNICDLNIRKPYYDKKLIKKLLEVTHVLKVNDEEVVILQDLFGLEKDRFHQAIGEKFGISVIIETKGKDGAIAFSGGRLAEAKGLEIEVVDTVGSGDAFLAAFIHHFLQHKTLDICLKHACKLGAFVATMPGAIPKHSDMPNNF